MKKKIFLTIIVFMLIFVTGCEKTRQSALDFKEEYESVNDKVLRGDIKYRTLNINEKNPYIKVTPEEIVEKINNKETFYLYVGDPLCPWCRSGLEKMIEVAIDKGIKDIYYIDFWDDEHNEILRDLYDIKINKKDIEFIKTQDSAKGYDEILEAVSLFVQDYTITKDDVTYNVGVKRIYGGDHFYFEKGICKKYVSLRSDKLAKSSDELTKEVLDDQQKNFEEFFEPIVCTGESDC